MRGHDISVQGKGWRTESRQVSSLHRRAPAQRAVPCKGGGNTARGRGRRRLRSGALALEQQLRHARGHGVADLEARFGLFGGPAIGGWERLERCELRGHEWVVPAICTRWAYPVERALTDHCRCEPIDRVAEVVPCSRSVYPFVINSFLFYPLAPAADVGATRLGYHAAHAAPLL